MKSCHPSLRAIHVNCVIVYYTSVLMLTLIFFCSRFQRQAGLKSCKVIIITFLSHARRVVHLTHEFEGKKIPFFGVAVTLSMGSTYKNGE